MPVEDIAEAIIVMPVEELQILADLINELLKDKLTELQSDVKVGDMVSFEAKKGIVVEGVVTELTNTPRFQSIQVVEIVQHPLKV